MRCDVEVVRAVDGTVVGRLAAPAGGPPVTFHGWLELLRALEVALTEITPPGGSRPT